MPGRGSYVQQFLFLISIPAIIIAPATDLNFAIADGDGISPCGYGSDKIFLVHGDIEDIPKYDVTDGMFDITVDSVSVLGGHFVVGKIAGAGASCWIEKLCCCHHSWCVFLEICESGPAMLVTDGCFKRMLKRDPLDERFSPFLPEHPEISEFFGHHLRFILVGYEGGWRNRFMMMMMMHDDHQLSSRV